jgi:rubredoxin
MPDDKTGQPYWQCRSCGHAMQAAEPPDVCPSCARKCEFTNVTCYTPECGLKGPDPKLMGGGK